MTNFLTHLRDSVIEGKLYPKKSKTGDWFSLLNNNQIDELVSLVEKLSGGDRDAIEAVSLLVHNLCGLEGVNLYQQYKDDLAQAAAEFSVMVNLEQLQRRKLIIVHNGISFLHDCEVEFLVDPRELPKLFNFH